MVVEIFHDVEAAPVDIEVDVSLLEIGCMGFPDRHFRVQLFDKTPGGITDALAVNLGVDKQQLQFATLAFHTDNGTANFLPVEENAVGFGVFAINGGLDGGTGNDFTVLFKMIVTETELLGGSVLERPLVVEDELLAVVGLQPREGYIVVEFGFH